MGKVLSFKEYKYSQRRLDKLRAEALERGDRFLPSFVPNETIAQIIADCPTDEEMQKFLNGELDLSEDEIC